MSSRSNGRDEDLEQSGAATATEESGVQGGLQPSLAEPAPAAESEQATPEEASEGAAVDEVETLRREVAELQQALLRRRADFENYRKRVERDRGSAAVEAEAAVLKQLLGTVDNLERALGAQDGGPGLREGVVLTHHELIALLQSLGVETLDPLGRRFDPGEHQAILYEPAEGFEPGTVAEVYRKGFRYRDRLLRPALVKVASESAGPGPVGGDVQ
jgi:molecular chaperone GrpE